MRKKMEKTESINEEIGKVKLAGIFWAKILFDISYNIFPL